jgi:lysophospholipase L1-like esterase
MQEDFSKANIQNLSTPGHQLTREQIYHQLITAYQSGFIPDYILVNGGGNDMINQESLGTLDPDNYLMSENYNTDTIIGALEHFFTNAQSYCPNAKIIFFNLYKMHPEATQVSYSTQRETWEQIRLTCQKYGIKYVDLYNECGFTPAISSQWETYMMKNEETGETDWVHIGEAGYRRFWPLIKTAMLES